MIYTTGDVHGASYRNRYNLLSHGYIPTKDDLLIVLGDCGLLWKAWRDGGEKEQSRIMSSFPYRILWLDGNHENHNRIRQLEEVPMFGGVVGLYNDKIIHLKRGEVYIIEGIKIFVMGGAASHDKETRKEHISWWKEEIPSEAEFSNGIDNLLKHKKKVDYILGHTGPRRVWVEYLNSINAPIFPRDNCAVSKYFDYITSEEFGLEFKSMKFGHFHTDWTSSCGKYHILYNNIIKLVE